MAYSIGAAGEIAGLIPDDPVRLRTLTRIRWVAIVGQITALMVVHYGLGFPVPFGPALAVVGASLSLNLAAMLGWPSTVRLGERSAAAFLAFDICQLAVLLYLTGGLENPFSFLLLAPVAVSATILSLRSICALSVLSIGSITLLAMDHHALPWTGSGFSLPRVYVLGIWVAFVTGIVFFATYTWRVAEGARRMSGALVASQLALAREQRLAALGGLAAAAAHELGSPLGTIAVVAREIARELPADSPIGEDVELLMSETARCRDILAELAGRPEEEDASSPFARLPLRALVQAAAERHEDERVTLDFDVGPDGDDGAEAEPVVVRRPDIVHGLGNLVQNAIQFAHEKVVVRIRWDRETATITIRDDGLGFPGALLEQLGEPYISMRNDPGDHMGLGIFIARTLLQRSGARVTFENDARAGGAVATVFWQRERIEICDEDGGDERNRKL